MSLGLLATPTVTICKVAKMVFNVAPGNFYLSQYLEYQEANGTSATVEALAGLAGGTDAAFITTVLTNLGLADDAGAQAFLESSIAASGRGAALEAAITALDNVAADDATYGAAATAFNTAVTTSVVYSTNAANNSTNVATLAAAIDADTIAAAETAGISLALTTGVDSVVGTAGNDTFEAIQSATGTTETWGTADTIDGGAGNDILYLTSEEGAVANLATVTNVESLVYRSTVAGAHIDLANLTSIENITMDRTVGATNLSGVALTDTVTLNQLAADAQTTVTYTATDVTGSADAATINLNGVKNGAELTLANDVETINLVASGAASRLDVLVLDAQTTKLTIDADEKFTVDDTFTTAGVKTLTVTGDSLVKITPTLVDATTTVDASGMTGGGLQVLIGNATATVTGSPGDDVIAFAAGELTSVDTVTGGLGTDTLSIMDETINAALYKEINASSGFEKLAMAATGAGTDMAIAAASLDSINTIVLSGAAPVGTIPAAAADNSGNAGTVTMAITDYENDDSVEVSKDVTVTGGAGGASTTDGNDGGDGADAVTVANLVDGGSNSFTITLNGGVTITGGAGGANAVGAVADNGGDGGDGISAATTETLNIVSTGDSANAIAGGAGGSATTDGAAGASVTINTNGTINVTGSANLDLGTIAGTNATVDATDFTGKLTVTAEAGNNTIIGGSKADTITGGDGQDVVTGGAGTDIFIFATDADAELATASATDANTITDYSGDILRLSDTTGNDVYSVAGTATGAVATSNVAIDANGLVTFAADDDTLAEKITAIAADADIANNEVAIFNHGSDTYVYGASDTAVAADDFIIKLTGVTLTTITEQSTSGDFVVS